MMVMFSCWRRPAVRASCRKRSRNSSVTRVSFLIATGRSRLVSKALYTTPMPPRPSSWMTSKRPILTRPPSPELAALDLELAHLDPERVAGEPEQARGAHLVAARPLEGEAE